MNKWEQIIVYLFSFLFFPIGIIVWIVSLFAQNPPLKKIGRRALFVAFASFIIFTGIGFLNFITFKTVTTFGTAF
ncbi:hypothetical protein NDK47_22000 [Brevibacillus ruminantium]|uniref:Uncharacterized protein n=1 Tax=Brevibacillus ruminantium TaxID=2950604 RepID=A0ABY4WC73_9BACL|nr:hypothetical protein [Brevibacillus ruminantium]USG64770.1 hypothetical protein NDK47_22000 [Brevibacillus ruminantium]